VCLYRDPTDVVVDLVIFAGNLCHHAAITFDIAENKAEGGLLFHDSFTDTEGTLLSAHTPDLNRKGNSWDAHATTEISGNALYLQGSANAVVDVEESDLTIETVWKSHGSRIDLGICARETDVDNCWLIVVDTLTNDKFYIIERNGASNTTRASIDISFNANDDLTFKAVLNGSTIKAYIQDESSNAYALIYSSATFQQTATAHGIYAYATPSVTWDYIKMFWSAFDD
jgi:hypothetical protein